MEAETVCIANIGPRERRKRLIFGAVSLALSVGLFVPSLSAGLGFFQWHEKT